MERAAEILRFWQEDVGEARWYQSTPELDALIRRRHARDWRAARAGAFDPWVARPEGALALLLLLDQFPRNMWRGKALAFATDAKAVRVARRAVALGHDRRIAQPLRQFFYLPFEHSERMAEQDMACRLMAVRLTRDRENLLHARVHREIIRRFGRFPGRNAARGLAPRAGEAEFLATNGYGALLKALA